MKNEIKINKFKKFNDIDNKKKTFNYIEDFINIPDIKKILILWPSTIYDEDNNKTYSDSHYIFHIDEIGSIEKKIEKYNFFKNFFNKIFKILLYLIYTITKNEYINQIKKNINKNQDYYISLYNQKELLIKNKNLNKLKIENQKIRLKIKMKKNNKIKQKKI
ncbi:MAG: hypothetical protein BGWL_c3650 [Candidatus Phytoplasma cynodontis]|uniref:hypothetical protein n=1 Tax='Cynodon dactylon' phytoplasma TaxID=295320 RepID=UPI001265D6CF|nr:hypothetical protein ['Cynodon dactylon' phytoplasma]KAB8121765.1 hypothetical protein F1741_01850 ['Cynodon dactylon' phytoplasma]WIA07849.1 MAG: hypothetical protein BGWL_c3650 [Candidatus Phytoplasma cynodontis]